MIKKTLSGLLALGIAALALLFSLGPKAIDADLNSVVKHDPYPVSERAQALHDDLIVGDWHADTLLWNRDISKRYEHGHVDLPRLQKGNVGLQMFTTVTKSPKGQNYHKNSADAPDNITRLAMVQRWPVNTWSSLSARALYQAQKLHTFETESPDQLFIIKTQADLATWQSRREAQPRLVGGLIGTEGSHALEGKLENVQILFDAGFRMMSLQHFFDNKIGGSLHGTSQAGLTPFGREVVGKILDLSIILDVSHSSEQTVKDVLAMTDRALVVSHTGFRGHCDTARNISDDLIQRIAANGGLIAVGYWSKAVCGTHPKAVVGAMKYGLELVGEDHISLGSDFDGSVTTGFDTSELAALTHEMLAQGFTENQIRKIMGGNMLRLLKAQLPAQ